MTVANVNQIDKRTRTRIDQATLVRSVRELLAEGIEGARRREESEFDRLAGPARDSIVLFGAGGLGRSTLAGLRKLGREPLAFVDSNSRLWNTCVDGLKVLSPEEASRQYADSAVFVISIWTGGGYDRMGQRQSQLCALGCKSVIPFTPLFWKYPKVFLPHYAVDLPHKVHEQAEAVLAACDVWDDDNSRHEYLAQLRWRLLGDFDCLPDPVGHVIYFPSDLYRLTDDEVFVDCGAYDGDTVRSFLEQSKKAFRRIFAFEPDPLNFVKLKRFVSGLPEAGLIMLDQAAVSCCSGSVSFCASGTEASYVGDGGGTTTVRAIALDEALAGADPTYIKMDIEGAELDALGGARRLIQNCAPRLAVCSYHRQDHLWKIPLFIASVSSKYQFFLRPHLLEVWDLVCYAIPSACRRG
jgi:FkbM family methyltransferase